MTMADDDFTPSEGFSFAAGYDSDPAPSDDDVTPSDDAVEETQDDAEEQEDESPVEEEKKVPEKKVPTKKAVKKDEAESESEEEDASKDEEEPASTDDASEEDAADADDDAAKGPEVTDETEFEVDGTKVPFADLKEAYQVANTALQRLQEANQRTEQLNGLVKDLDENLFDAAIRFKTAKYEGDVKTARAEIVQQAAAFLNQHVEHMRRPEAERIALERDEEVKRLRAELEQARNDSATKEQQKQRAKTLQAVTEKITDAAKETGLNPDESVIRAIALEASKMQEAGLTVDYKRAAVKYKRSLDAQKAALLKALKPEDLPEEVVKELTKKQIEEIKRKKSKPTATKKRSRDENSEGSKRVSSLFDED